MNRISLAASAAAVLAGLATLVGARHPGGMQDAQPVAAPIASSEAPSLPASSALARPVATSAPSLADDEAAFMASLRRADPTTMLALCREGNRRYAGTADAEEREARAIDALVALDDIGEAHTEAMLFVQHHPSGPFTAHIVNLMGVHLRPPGAVPEPALAGDRR